MIKKITVNQDNLMKEPKGFILHGTLGSYNSAINWLYEPCEKRNPTTYSSAHYVVSKTGEITQLVENNKRAWHAGTVSNPTEYAQKILLRDEKRNFINPNNYLIGIELENITNKKEEITEAQKLCVLQIIKESEIQNPIILSHGEITSYKSDNYPELCIEIKNKLATVSPPLETREEKIAKIINLINQL